MTTAKHCFLHSHSNYNMDLILPMGRKENFLLFGQNPPAHIAELCLINDPQWYPF